MIKNLVPRLAEVGKIKCGIKGRVIKSANKKEFMLPEKLDHFIVTTLERDAAGRLMNDVPLMNRLSQENEKLTELPIRLLYDDIDLNFPTRYALYSGNKCMCSGDGKDATWTVNDKGETKAVECPCKRQDPAYQSKDKCKINGTLSCIIEGSEKLGGCYKFRTTSFNSVTNILSSLAFIKTLTGGRLAWIPLVLTLAPKSTTIPGSNQATTVYCASIEFRGEVRALQELGYEVAKNQIEHKINMANIEQDARQQRVEIHEDAQEAQDIQEEFYPENIDFKTDPEKEKTESPTNEQKELGKEQKPARIYVFCPKLKNGGRRSTEVCEKKCPDEKCEEYYNETDTKPPRTEQQEQTETPEPEVEETETEQSKTNSNSANSDFSLF